MALKKNLLLMGFATAVRLIAGLLTFSIVARLLGPESFGVLMLWFSVSALLSLCTNFGLTTYVLREIGADPGAAESIINEGLTGKLLLAVLVFACAGVAAWGFEIEFKQVFLYLLVASVADTFSEFLNAGLRARDRFDVETRLATITSLTHAAIVVTAVWVSPKIEVAAAAYALSRLVALAITVPAITKNFAAPKLAAIGVSLTRLRKATSYAVDFGFQSLFGQVDSVVLNHYLGPVSVGLYQAGMRIFQGGSAAVQVLANVFLPRAAGKTNDAGAFGTESKKIQIAFLTFGALFGMTMAVFSELIVKILFGPAYLGLTGILPLFGLLFFVRFAAAAWGVVLTAAGEQRYRTFATVTHWGLIACIAPFLVPALGVAGWLISVIFGNALLGFLYAMRGAKRVASPWITVGMTALGGVAFVPFLRVYP
jgi:O-antigen/teichoic acid export membrane protein